MWEQNPSPYYLNKQIVVLWIIRDTTCRKNCYPSKMATIKVVPLSSLGLSNPLLTFGCHVFTHFCETAAMIWHISDTMSQWGICSFFKKNEPDRGYPFFHMCKRKILSRLLSPRKEGSVPINKQLVFFSSSFPFLLIVWWLASAKLSH